MIFNFELSRLALMDLEEIWLYTSKIWSKQQANKYYEEKFKVINEIFNNSRIGESIDFVKKGHRKINIKSHVIIYKIASEIIYIDRILHHNMDIEAYLNK
jgi:toxin ParE1/3/4